MGMDRRDKLMERVKERRGKVASKGRFSSPEEAMEAKYSGTCRSGAPALEVLILIKSFFGGRIRHGYAE